MSLHRVISVTIFFSLLAFLYLSIDGANFFDACDAPVTLESSNPEIQCISLIDDDLSFPRNVVSLTDNLWLVDKGTDLFESGSAEGTLYRYTKEGKSFVRETVLEDLLDPNDIAHRADKAGRDWVYVSTSNQVFRLRADLDDIQETVESRQNLIDNIPTEGWHKLTAIAVSQKSLWLTVPSASDHCELTDDPNGVQYPCQESDHPNQEKATALIRRYQFDENDQLKPGFTIVARGLRDALAVVVNVQANSVLEQLIAADNGWDQIDLNALGLDWRDTPADEINIINGIKPSQQPAHFGWPYCYADNQVTHPYAQYVQSCDAYQQPHLLLTAHMAPLTMIYHQGRLLVNLHGPRPEAGRTVAYEIDDQGLPVGEHQTLIDWAYTDGEGTRGRPLGLASGPKNEVYITDDWDQRLMRVILR